MPTVNFTTAHINDIEIPQKESMKNLGVLIDSELNFEAHVNNKLRMLYIKLKSLYNIVLSLFSRTKLNTNWLKH